MKPKIIVGESKRKHIENTYGISLEQYNSLREVQKYRCAICLLPEVYYQEPLLVDHDHETGEVRGLLCRRCNVGLGMFQDNPKRIIKAAAYIVGIQKLTLLIQYVKSLIVALDKGNVNSKGLFFRPKRN